MSTTDLTAAASVTIETVLFGSLITEEITRTLATSTTLSNRTLSRPSHTTSSSTAITSTIMSTTTASASTASGSPSSSGVSKNASIGIGVGLAVAVLLIIGALLWFFSFHKRYQEDVGEMEIGPNATDYRRKAASIDALSSRPPTNHDVLASSQHTRAGSKGSKYSQDVPPIPEVDIERPKAPTPRTSMSPDYESHIRGDGFF